MYYYYVTYIRRYSKKKENHEWGGGKRIDSTMEDMNETEKMGTTDSVLYPSVIWTVKF